MTQFSPKTLLIAVCFMSFSLSQAQEFIEEPIHAKNTVLLSEKFLKRNALVYHKLSSIDRLFFNPNHVIASGHEMFPVENQWLKIYQHKESHYENCTKEIINECSFFGKENMEFTPRLEISNPHILPTPEPRENNEGIIKNICK